LELEFNFKNLVEHYDMKKIILTYCLVLIIAGDFTFGMKRDTILAKIGDMEISTIEFSARAEYTPRPAYCRSDNYIHKKIILNTLIAEKLMAKEAGNDNELTQSSEYKAFIKGRKEQAMRQVHFYEMAYKISVPDSASVAEKYSLAGRTYELSFFRIVDSTNAFSIYNKVSNNRALFNSVYSSIGIGDTIPKKEISFFTPEIPEVTSKLFERPLDKDEILKPIFVGDSYLLLRVDGWVDELAITERAKESRWNDVSLLMTEQEAMTLYTDYVAKLMKGKNVQFDRGTFEKLVEVVAPFYIKDEKKKEAMFNKNFWRSANEDEVLMSNFNDADFLKESPLFTLDGEIWNVSKLMDEIKIHPLVFRKNELRKQDFAEQFKLAIIDLIRDKEITKDSYKNGFDKNNLVTRNVEMWSGNLLSNYQKYLILKNADVKGKDKSILFDEVLNPYVKTLQKKYSNEIKINVDEFEKIKLSKIDMLGLQTDMAFPFVVPLFPELTTLNKLDYGKVLK